MNSDCDDDSLMIRIQGGDQRAFEQVVDRYQGPLIGFFFRNADRNKIKELEYQLTAQFLGAPVVYRGRPLDVAHAKHPIMGGQFARRLQILKQTLEEFRAPEAVRDAWVQHNESLRALITPNSGSDCDPSQAREKSPAFDKGT